MANTVQVLNYTNTFGDLLAQENVIAKELNNLGANTYTKDSGTLYLNGVGTGLFVTNTAIMGAGIVSSTLAVSGDTTLLANVYLNAPGYTLQVANNAIVHKTILTDTVNANTLVRSTVVNASSQVFGGNVSSNNLVSTVNLLASGSANVRDLKANSSISAPYINATTRGYFEDITANNQINAAYLNLSGNVTSDLNVTTNVNGYDFTGNQATFNSIQAGQVSVEGNFVINGETVYNAPTFTLNSGSVTGQNSSLVVNRGVSGANAQIFWNEPLKYWQILNVSNSTFYRILTDDYLTSSLNVNDQYKVASAAAAYQLQTQVNSISSTLTANSGVFDTNISNVNNNANSSYARANTSANVFVGTTGTAIPNLGNITFRSNNGVVVSATANNLYVNTSQDLQTDSNPTFNSIYNLGNPLSISNGGTGSSNGVQGLINLLPNTSGAANGSVLTANGNTVYWASNGPYFANNITFTAPQGGIVSTANTIQLAINDLEARKATLFNPTFTGVPRAPTAANTTSNTMIATTAFVANAITIGINTALGGTGGGTAQINISGNANTVNNGVYTTGSYTNPSWMVSLDGSKITGSISGSAGSVNGYAMNQNLNIGDNVRFNSIGVGTNPSGSTGDLRAVGNITAYYSDDRLKTRLNNIPNALQKVLGLNGFYYQANEVAQSLGYEIKREVGVSAQEVQSILPEIVAPAPIDEQYLTVHYERLVPLLIEAIKELKAEIDSLKN
jgi:hypothetical protein